MDIEANRRPGIKQAAVASIVPGAVGAVLACSTIAVLGRLESGSAVAPLNASSQVFWGERAGQVERLTFEQTLPGLAINVGASFWWAFVLERLFGGRLDRSGLAGALGAGAATATLAYVLDYRILPRRLSPGWEQRLSDRSLLMSLAALGVGLGVGAWLARRRRH